MDENVVRTVNEGPMGPQGPVKVNHCIMNNKAGYKPVVRLFNLENIQYEDEEEEVITGDITGGGAGGSTVSGGGTAEAGAGESTISGGGASLDEGEENEEDIPGSGMFDNPTIKPGDVPLA